MDLRKYIEDSSIPVPFVGCWMWLKSLGSHGYGNGIANGVITTAHRVAYRAFKGHIPVGLLVQHSCNNRWCVNPEHLSVGFFKSNALDKQRDGRAAKRLTPGVVRRVLSETGTYASISRKTGVSKGMVSKIKRRESWAHIDPPGGT